MTSELRNQHYKFYGEASLYNRIKTWQDYGKHVSFSAALRELALIGLMQVEPLMKNVMKTTQNTTVRQHGDEDEGLISHSYDN